MEINLIIICSYFALTCEVKLSFMHNQSCLYSNSLFHNGILINYFCFLSNLSVCFREAQWGILAGFAGSANLFPFICFTFHFCKTKKNVIQHPGKFHLQKVCSDGSKKILYFNYASMLLKSACIFFPLETDFLISEIIEAMVRHALF